MPGPTPLLAVSTTLLEFGLAVGGAGAAAGMSRIMTDDAALQASLVATFCVISGAIAFGTGRYVLTIALGAIGVLSLLCAT